MVERTRRRVRVAQVVLVAAAAAAVGMAGMVLRPIETTLLLVVAAAVFASLALRSRPGAGRRVGAGGIALGCLAVLAFYWTSALVNLEPDHVEGSGTSVARSDR